MLESFPWETLLVGSPREAAGYNEDGARAMAENLEEFLDMVESEGGRAN
jgi:hypothetical protein